MSRRLWMSAFVCGVRACWCGLTSISRVGICNSLFAKNCSPCSFPCTGPKTVLVCPCPSPKGWYQADQGADSLAVCIYFSLSDLCMASLSWWGCRGAGGAVCMECVSESAWLAWCVHASCHGSADFSLSWLCSGFGCRSLVACCIVRAAWVGGGP